MWKKVTYENPEEQAAQRDRLGEFGIWVCACGFSNKYYNGETPGQCPKCGTQGLSDAPALVADLSDILPEVVLSEDERTDLRRLEMTVRQNLRTMFEIGQALREIRDRRLYRETHSTFEGYTKDVFDIGKAYGNRLIGGVQVIENLAPIGAKFKIPMLPLKTGSRKMVPMGTQDGLILPQNESQTRPLTALDPETQKAVWLQVVDRIKKGENLTSKLINRIIREHTRGDEEKIKPPSGLPDDPCEVCRGLSASALCKGKGCCKACKFADRGECLRQQYCRLDGTFNYITSTHGDWYGVFTGLGTPKALIHAMFASESGAISYAETIEDAVVEHGMAPVAFRIEWDFEKAHKKGGGQ